MSKWQNKHINKYYAIETLRYGMMQNFILQERKAGKDYERKQNQSNTANQAKYRYDGIKSTVEASKVVRCISYRGNH